MNNLDLAECADCGDIIDGAFCEACNLIAYDSEFTCTECGQTLFGIDGAFCPDCKIHVSIPFATVIN